MMKKTRFFAVFAVALFFGIEARAFTASYEQVTRGVGIDEPQQQTVRIKDDKIRIEMRIKGKPMITIIDGKNMYSYQPARNTAIKMAYKKPLGMKVLPHYADHLKSLNARVVGSEKIGVYDCDIYEFTDPRLNTLSKVWLWREKQFPVKVETQAAGGAVTSLMKDVKIGIDIDDSVFMLPEGVDILDLQETMRR